MAMRICIQTRNTARWLTDRLRQERGQSLIEFAVVLPVLILIVLGILYFGRFEDYANQETQLAEEGARMAAVNTTPPTTAGCTSPTTLACYLQAQAQPELQKGSSAVSSAAKVYIYQPTGITYAVGNSVRVCVVSTFTFPSPIGTPSTQVAMAATMRIEDTAAGAATLPYATSGNSANGNPGGVTTPPTSTGCPTT
jgi:Flp pilus assembly protein TadG